jgi:hypothetical protein
VTPQILAEVGRMLHGEDFVAALARDLKMNVRNLQRMLANTAPIPQGVRFDILRLIDARRQEISEKLGLCGWFADRTTEPLARAG